MQFASVFVWLGGFGSRDKCAMSLRVLGTGSVVRNSKCRCYMNSLRG
jgi:hypothetical protein